MRYDLHIDVEGRRLAQLVPKPYRNAAAVALRKDALYTAVVFSQLSRGAIPGEHVQHALERVGELGSTLLVVAPDLSRSARKLVFERAGIALTPTGLTHATEG